MWLIALLTTLGFSAWVLFIVGQPPTDPQGDPRLQELDRSVADAPGEDDARLERTWGRSGGASTLVLYDTEGDGMSVSDAELDGIAAGNLASHFGRVRAEPVADYTASLMRRYDAVVYVGSSEAQDIPRAFYDDTIGGDTPVLWAGANIRDFAGKDSALASRFEQNYGWDPNASVDTGPDVISGVRYRRHELTRDVRRSGFITVPQITGTGQVEVLATTTEETPRPWAIRSDNLTYVGEVPLKDVDETDRYLAFADLYFDLLADETPPVAQAALRLSDVHPGTDTYELREVGDYLHEQDIPFQVAVTPIRVTSTGEPEAAGQRATSLADRPQLVGVLAAMQNRGATIVQHGTTHQYGKLKNPYGSDSGADAEFYRVRCSLEPTRPFDVQPCDDKTHVVGAGPVGGDEVSEWVHRLSVGREAFQEVRLGRPVVFESPFDIASPHAYVAMTEVYDSRYERSWYFAGQLSGDPIRPDRARSQFFPYSVHDVYGLTVLPDNVGALPREEHDRAQENRPKDLLEDARANLAMRESVASLSIDPSLGLDDVRSIVEGVEDLGYTFVAVKDLK